ncbi:MAG: GntR family transcriptional regulator [Chloroflexota bacterium]
MSEPTTIGLDEIATVHSSPTTLYHSLGHIIRSKIQSGEWAVGQQIPSEREMMQIFNISRATVRQGIENLVKEGVLHRIQGKGTFVAPPKIEQGVLRLMEFSDVVKQNGLKPSGHLLGKEHIVPPPNIRQLLALSDLEQVVWLQRLLRVNETPILIETSYFPAARFPNLLEAYDGLEEPHKFVYKHYGIRVTRARETFEPVILEDKEAHVLGTQGGFPALWVEHLAFEATEKPVAYLTSLLRGDRCRFYTDLVFER